MRRHIIRRHVTFSNPRSPPRRRLRSAKNRVFYALKLAYFLLYLVEALNVSSLGRENFPARSAKPPQIAAGIIFSTDERTRYRRESMSFPRLPLYSGVSRQKIPVRVSLFRRSCDPRRPAHTFTRREKSRCNNVKFGCNRRTNAFWLRDTTSFFTRGTNLVSRTRNSACFN